MVKRHSHLARGGVNMNNDITKITITDFSRSQYIKDLANAERQISSYKNQVRYGISNTISKRFGVCGDCFQVFDKRAGGILFKDWEWELIPNSSKLKELFFTKDKEELIYSVETDEGKLLRGSDTYYYFLSNKGKNQMVTKEMVYNWARNNIEFLKNAIDSFPSTNQVDPYNRRLILAVLDNVRNLSLIMLNASIVKNTNMQDSLVILSNRVNGTQLNKWSKLVQTTIRDMGKMCFEENINGTLCEEIRHNINNVIENCIEDVKKICDNSDKIDLGKAFRSYREIDNFIENYITMFYVIQKIKEKGSALTNKQINFIGAAYGGLELPFITREIWGNEIMMSAMILQNKYKDRIPENFLNGYLNLVGEYTFGNDFNVLGDDNILTGKTLQSMINLLYANGIKVDNVAVVRYPSLNRVDQMIAENSAVDTTKLFNYIQGLVFSSPYSKIKSAESVNYLDELGIFNKDRRRLLEYLYKNGRFTSDSEVANVGRNYERG